MDENRDIYGPDERADDRYHDLKDNGLVRLTPLTIWYAVEIPSELSAGIRGFTEVVKITVTSGDPGGDPAGPDNFREFMKQALRDWYDTPNVVEIMCMGG